MDNTETINILSLCTGYGGLELGMSLALEGVLRVVAVEVEAYALANLAAKAQEGRLAVEAMWPDLKTFPAERFRGCFDFVLAGYPCQPWSVAGKRGGSTDERHLWPDICRIIEAVRPLYICIENVPGLLSGRILDNRPDLVEYLTSIAEEERKAGPRDRWYISEHRRRLTRYLLQKESIQAYAGVYLDLQDIGYQIEPGLFSASEIGPDAAGNFCPHKRQRLFILAKSEQRWRGRLHGEPSGQGWALQVEGSGQLADAESGRTGGRIKAGESFRQKTSGRRFSDSCKTRWPARPGQPQYEWEEPRVVADAVQNRNRISRAKTEPSSNEPQNGISEQDCQYEQGQAQSSLGLQLDGRAKDVGYAPDVLAAIKATGNDQLRLLGNGVVRQQAEKAIRELMNEFEI